MHSQIVISDQFLKSHLPTEADEQIVYKGEFIVTRGDFIPIASDASGLSFVQTEKAKFYQMKLDQIFSASHISKSFLFNEILLLEGLSERSGSSGVKVHFNIHMSSPEGKISVRDIYSVLREQINGKDPAQSFLAELDIDEESLVIEGLLLSCSPHRFTKKPIPNSKKKITRKSVMLVLFFYQTILLVRKFLQIRNSRLVFHIIQVNFFKLFLFQ